MSSDALSQALSVGKLIDLKWKIGVTAQSSDAASSQSAHVGVHLIVEDPDGKQATHSFELSLPEFHTFSKQFKEASNLLATQ